MSPTNFTLRWESTGDKWWYASPIDWAAANGHYDLVRQLLRLDGNHLINLTSLRRVRRLEAVWDDEDQFDDVAKCRCQVAHQLFNECRAHQHDGKNSLIAAGYGGWLLYTAASAGDLMFVQEILGKHPLLVFGEGEYGLTDILYAAARSKNGEVFRMVYESAVSPRFLTKNGGEVIEHIEEELPLAFKSEVKNRAVHAAARGGNLVCLKQLLADCEDVLEFRDVHGCTVLHAAAGRGQVEVVRHLIASYDMISAVDDKGNTPFHVAAYKGQLSALEALIQASPSSASAVNKAGDTFLHMAVAGFQTPGFRRLDRQIEFLKQLVRSKTFCVEDIINLENNEGRTALHLAIIGNIHSDLVGLLMTARFINVNSRDNHGMTPLDYLKRQPRSASSEILIRQLISAGGISSCKDSAVRKAFALQLKMQGLCSSPGTSFRMSDHEVFLCTGIDDLPYSGLGPKTALHFRSYSELSQCDSTNGDISHMKKSGPLQYAAKHFKTMFHWPSKKRRATEQSKKTRDDNFSDKIRSTLEETPIPLRERYSNAASLPSNKRTLAERSNISSPSNRKKFASGFAHDDLLVNLSAHTPSTSISSLASQNSLDKGKGMDIEDEIARPSSSKEMTSDDSPRVIRKQGSMVKRFLNPAMCFGGSRLSIKNPLGKHSFKQPVQSAA